MRPISGRGVGRRVRAGCPTLVAALLALAGCSADEVPPAAPRIAAPALGSKVFPLAAAPALDDPDRERWQRPAEVIEALSIEPGTRLADVGCGTGYFTLRLLEAAGPRGTVIAVDVQQGMLDILRNRLKEADRKRVELRRSPSDRPLLPTDAVNLALCANTLYEVDDGEATRFVKSMADGLAPGGQLAVIEWRPEEMRLGPPLADRIAPERVRALAEAAGLALEREYDFLPLHSFLLFSKPK